MHIEEPFVDKVWKEDPIISGIMNAEQYRAIKNHNYKARIICAALSMTVGEFNGLWEHERERIYGELAEILYENPRLALYLPFYVLKNPTAEFKKHYRNAWYRCSLYYDIREAFHLGDIYEASASQGEPEMVTKSMHLIPWLLHYGYITEEDIIHQAHMSKNEKNVTFWSIYDGVCAAHTMGWISGETFDTIQNISHEAQCPRPKPQMLVRVTEERKKWLKDRTNGYNVDQGEFKLHNPTGPFIDNVDYECAQQVKIDTNYEFVILHDSTLKGYGRPDSDHDFYHYDAISGTIREFPEMSEMPEMAVHLIMFGAWIGPHGESTRAAQMQAASRYYKLSERSRINSLLIEEKATLHYRLMHKGMFCAYANISEKTKHLDSIDGDSAFYDDRYRKIASQLFLKYIFLPPRE